MRLFASLSRHPVLLRLTLAGCWSLREIANGVGWALKAPEQQGYILRHSAVDGLLGLAVCSLLFLVYDRVRDRLELGPFLWLVAPLCSVAAMVWHAASMYAMGWFGWNDQLWLDPKALLVAGGIMDGITLALFSLLFLAVDHRLQLRGQREKAREATALAQQA